MMWIWLLTGFVIYLIFEILYIKHERKEYMNKLSIVIICFAFLFVCACKEKGIEEISTSELESLGHYQYCSFSGYFMQYVDGIDTSKCYAFRNVNISNTIMETDLWYTLKEYGNDTYEDSWDYFYKKENKECEEIRDRGNLWCLRNMTKCLKLEDNDKICVVMYVPEEMWRK